MKFICKAFFGLLCLLQAHILQAEGRVILGSDLKNVAAKHLADAGIF